MEISEIPRGLARQREPELEQDLQRALHVVQAARAMEYTKLLAEAEQELSSIIGRTREFETLSHVVQYVIKEVPQLKLSETVRLKEPVQIAEALKKAADSWERQLEVQQMAVRWLLHGDQIYELTRGRMRRTHGLRVAGYLRDLAERNPYLRADLLREASRIAVIADQVADKDKIHISPSF